MSRQLVLVANAATLGLLTVAPALAQSPQIGPIHNPTTGNRYVMLTQSTWTAANTYATANLGGHLATVNDKTENDWIANTFFADLGASQWRHLWIGYTDTTGNFNWSWSSGESSSYTNWYPGEPNFLGSERWTIIVGPNPWSSQRTWQWNNLPNWDHWGAPEPVHAVVEIAPNRQWRSASNGAFNSSTGWRTTVGNTLYAPTQHEDATFAVAGTYTVQITPLAAARTVSVSAGNVSFAGTAQTLTVSQTTTVASGAVLQLNGANLSTHALNLDGVASRFAWSGGDLTLSGGTSHVGLLSIPGNSQLRAAGTIQGSVNVGAGTLAPSASLNPLQITGALTMGSGSSLMLDITGSPANASFDRIQVSGAATLGGTLTLDFSTYSQPVIGSVYTYLVAGSIDGAFTSRTVSGLSPLLRVEFNDTAGTFSIQAIPEPSASVLLVAAAALGVRRRHRRIARAA